MKHKRFLFITLFIVFFCTLAAAQTRRIEAKKKPMENSGMDKPELMFNSMHSAIVESIAYSSDGRYLASGSSDKTIKLWEVETGRLLRTLTGHTDDVYSVSCSPDGKHLASGSYDETIKLWEVETGNCIRTLKGHTSYVKSVMYSPDGKHLASASWDNTVKIWEVETGNCIKTFTGHTGYVNSVAYSSDGKYLASASSDKTVKIWEVETGRLLRILIGHTDQVIFVSFAPDNNYAASSSFDRTIKLWDVKTGKCIKTLIGDTYAPLLFLSYSPDGKYLASSSVNEIKLWKVASGKCVKTLSGGTLAYSPDGACLATYHRDHHIEIWKVPAGECIKKIGGNSHSVYSFAYSHGGTYLVNASSGEIKLWEAQSGKYIKALEGYSSSAYSVVYSPNEKYLASGSDDNTIKLWEIATGECIKTLKGHSDDVNSVCYSPDGKYIASGSRDDTIKLWEAATWKCIKTLKGHKRPVTSVCFSPDGSYLASGSWDETIKIWNVATEQCINTLTGHTGWVKSVCYSPDGTYLASGSDDDTIKFWNAGTGELLATTFNLKDGEWLTYTPEGFFAGSEWATKNLVHIVDGMKTVGIDQMYDSFYRPDLVSSKLRGEDISAYAQRVNFASLVQSGSAPITKFLDLDDKIEDRDVTIEFAIENTGGGIGEVNLLLNGKNIRLYENVPSKSGQTLYFSHTVTLQNGENTLELYAKNEAGKVESLRARKTLNWHGNVKKPDLYVLTVAVNQYRDADLRLRYAVPDAKFIVQGFSNQKKSLYQNVFTFSLFDGDVTKEGIKSSFEKLGSQIQPDDVFVFYIAGHGVTYDEDGDYYYLPSDFRYRNAQDIEKQGISKKDLIHFLTLIKASKTLVLMDTCNSGSFLGGSTRGLSEKTAVDRLTRSTGHATIVASLKSQVAMEGYEGHGIFTYIFVEGLSGKADTNNDGFITLQELSGYVEEEVPRRSYEKWGYEQTPMRDLRKQDFPIHISGNR